jgi:hypothetical protein
MRKFMRHENICYQLTAAAILTGKSARSQQAVKTTKIGNYLEIWLVAYLVQRFRYEASFSAKKNVLKTF